MGHTFLATTTLVPITICSTCGMICIISLKEGNEVLEPWNDSLIQDVNNCPGPDFIDHIMKNDGHDMVYFYSNSIIKSAECKRCGLQIKQMLTSSRINCNDVIMVKVLK